MQCSSCGAPNKPEAKFCAECGKPLVSATDEQQIDLLTDYLADNWFDDVPPDASARQRLREAARDVLAKWKANPHLEDVEVKIQELDVEESFDGGELAEIFSGRDAAERAKQKLEAEAEEAAEQAEREKKRAKEEDKARDRAKEEAKGLKVNVAIISVIVAGVLVGGIIEERKKSKERAEEQNAKHEAHRTTRTTTATATTTATTQAIPEPPPPISIASCTCVSHANGKNTFVLQRPGDGWGSWHMKWDQVSSMLSMKSGFSLGESDAGAATSIARGNSQLHGVMACENDIVAVVAGDVASAWTGTESGELLWTRKLPGAYAFNGDAGTDDMCAPALGVTGNVFTVPIAKGKTITLSIRDGSIQK